MNKEMKYKLVVHDHLDSVVHCKIVKRKRKREREKEKEKERERERERAAYTHVCACAPLKEKIVWIECL